MRELTIRISKNGHQYFVEDNGKIEKVFYNERDAKNYINYINRGKR